MERKFNDPLTTSGSNEDKVSLSGENRYHALDRRSLKRPPRRLPPIQRNAKKEKKKRSLNPGEGHLLRSNPRLKKSQVPEEMVSVDNISLMTLRQGERLTYTMSSPLPCISQGRSPSPNKPQSAPVHGGCVFQFPSFCEGTELEDGSARFSTEMDDKQVQSGPKARSSTMPNGHLVSAHMSAHQAEGENDARRTTSSGNGGGLLWKRRLTKQSPITQVPIFPVPPPINKKGNQSNVLRTTRIRVPKISRVTTQTTPHKDVVDILRGRFPVTWDDRALSEYDFDLTPSVIHGRPVISHVATNTKSMTIFEDNAEWFDTVNGERKSPRSEHNEQEVCPLRTSLPDCSLEQLISSMNSFTIHDSVENQALQKRMKVARASKKNLKEML